MFDDQSTQTPGVVQPPSNLPTTEPEDILAGTDPVQSQTPPLEAVAPVSVQPPSALGAGILHPAQETPPAPAQPSIPPPVAPSSVAQPASLESVAHTSNSTIPNQLQEPTPASATIPSHTSDANGQPSIHIQTHPQTDDQQNYQIKHPVGSKRMLVLIVIIIVFAIVGGGGAWIYFSFIRG